VHNGDGKIVIGHGLFELFNSLFGVTVDKSLVDIKIGVQVKEYVHLPFLLLDSDVVLVDTFESELLVLYKNLGGVTHEVLSHTKNFWGKSS